MTSGSESSWVLAPRDGWFLKDGREWMSTVAGRAHSLDRPYPSTLLGALRTAWGRAEEVKKGRPLRKSEWKGSLGLKLDATIMLRRPLDRSCWGRAHRMWPVPADALFLPANSGSGATVVRLDPRPPKAPTLARGDDQACTALWRASFVDPRKPDRAPSWWPESAFAAWLCDSASYRPRDDGYHGVQQPRRTMVHVGIDRESGAAAESLLFHHDVVEPIDRENDEWTQWALAARTAGLSFSASWATVGSDRRLTAAEKAEDELFTPPDDLTNAFDGTKATGLRLIAVSPLVFERGWLPDGFNSCASHPEQYRGCLPGLDGVELILRAAMLPRPEHVSGWDMAARGPKPTARLVPPGAAYFFERLDSNHLSGCHAKALWLAALGGRTDEGYGRVVPGCWTPRPDASERLQ